jgi:hypothetical protein
MSKVMNYIVSQLTERQKAGLKKYGVNIDDCNPPTGSFYMEVIQETLDALQYMARANLRLQDEAKSLRRSINRGAYIAASEEGDSLGSYTYSPDQTGKHEQQKEEGRDTQEFIGVYD